LLTLNVSKEDLMQPEVENANEDGSQV